MSRIHKEHLQAGYIFGDTINQEYIYLPSGEVGTDHPLAVLETPTKREDITCLLYTSPSPRDPKTSRMPSSA